MRSSYGFKKILQAIYVVFERARIVTSHDAGAVFASISRQLRDASADSPSRALECARGSSRIFIEKNRVFGVALGWRPLIVTLF
jgi:hypothetical protein